MRWYGGNLSLSSRSAPLLAMSRPSSRDVHPPRSRPSPVTFKYVGDLLHEDKLKDLMGVYQKVSSSAQQIQELKMRIELYRFQSASIQLVLSEMDASQVDVFRGLTRRACETRLSEIGNRVEHITEDLVRLGKLAADASEEFARHHRSYCALVGAAVSGDGHV